MQSGRLNYAYRLSAARWVILRLRLARRFRRLFQSSYSSPRVTVIRVLIGMIILLAFPGSAWLGFRAGQHVETDSIGHKDQLPAVATSPPAAPETERVDQQAEAARIAELVNLRKTVGTLLAQVRALEQEAADLETELLDQQVDFAREEERWKAASVERRIVYNITNIPVGGSVSDKRFESDAEPAEFLLFENDVNDQTDRVEYGADPYDQYKDVDGLVERWNGDAYLADVLEQQSRGAVAGEVDPVGAEPDQQLDGQAESYPSSEPVPASILPADKQIRQETFFGPAPDRYDDWVNP